MRELLVWSLESARQQTLNLVEDLLEKQMCRQAEAGENHPGWILGHLILGDSYLLSMLKFQKLPADFSDLLIKYGPNSKPISGAETYESKDFLVERLTQTGLLRVNAVCKIKDFGQPTPDKTLAQTQPSIGHHLQMLVFHEGHHCGQLSSWRKSQGLSAVRGVFAV